MKTSKYTYTGKSSKYFTNGECYDVAETVNNDYTTKDNQSEEHGLSKGHLSDNFVLFTSNPVYTQAMYEAGELPSVGMEVMFKHGGHDTKGIVAAISKEYIVLSELSGKERIRKLSESPIKPLTPPVKLVDGEWYLVKKGWGSKETRALHRNNGAWFYDISQYPDKAEGEYIAIKLLTVA